MLKQTDVPFYDIFANLHYRNLLGYDATFGKMKAADFVTTEENSNDFQAEQVHMITMLNLAYMPEYFRNEKKKFGKDSKFEQKLKDLQKKCNQEFADHIRNIFVNRRSM